jgi:hypothetical protein
MPDGDDNPRDRRLPRPPSPEQLEEIRRARVEPEPFEPVVGEPHDPGPGPEDDRPGEEPVEPQPG